MEQAPGAGTGAASSRDERAAAIWINVVSGVLTTGATTVVAATWSHLPKDKTPFLYAVSVVGVIGVAVFWAWTDSKSYHFSWRDVVARCILWPSCLFIGYTSASDWWLRIVIATIVLAACLGLMLSLGALFAWERREGYLPPRE